MQLKNNWWTGFEAKKNSKLYLFGEIRLVGVGRSIAWPRSIKLLLRGNSTASIVHKCKKWATGELELICCCFQPLFDGYSSVGIPNRFPFQFRQHDAANEAVCPSFLADIKTWKRLGGLFFVQSDFKHLLNYLWIDWFWDLNDNQSVNLLVSSEIL